jgi:hypothetical protein
MVLSITTWKPATRQKRKRTAPPNTPAHNYADTAEAIVAMAVIIDPDAFADSDDAVRAMSIKERQRLAERRGMAMQKARDCATAYDYHLGNQRNVTVVIKQEGRARYFKVQRGQAADKTVKAVGSTGGLARAKALTPERRKEIAIKAAATRWGKR